MHVFLDRAFANMNTVTKANACGCYYCCTIYPSNEVVDYIPDTKGNTAICPKCSVDSVIPYDKELDGDLHDFEQFLQDCHNNAFKV